MDAETFDKLGVLKCPMHGAIMKITSMSDIQTVDTPVMQGMLFSCGTMKMAKCEATAVEKHFTMSCPHGCIYEYVHRDHFVSDDVKVMKG